MKERKGRPGPLPDPAGSAEVLGGAGGERIWHEDPSGAAGNDWIDAEGAEGAEMALGAVPPVQLGGAPESWCQGDRPAFGESLRRRMREKGGDAFSLAYELTKIYANSGGGDPAKIPALFAELFEMFESGADPRPKPGENSGKDRKKDKADKPDKKDKKDKDK